MKFLNTLPLLAALVLSSQALARDSKYLVCSGTPEVNGERVSLAFIVRESRASDGLNRQEVISMVYQDDLYQGKTLAVDGPNSIFLANQRKPDRIFYSGSYQINWQKQRLRLEGSINQLPGDQGGAFEDLNATLDCEDLSV